MKLKCSICKTTFRLEGKHEPLEEDMAKGPVKCPLCLQPSVATSVSSMGEEADHHLTMQEFWQATHGFGLPEEIVTEPETVTAMLLAHEIIGVSAYRSRSGRVVINDVLLSNGISLHFTASGEGAVIFKSTRMQEKKENAS